MVLSQPGNGDYNAASPVAQSFSINGDQTINLGSLADKRYGDPERLASLMVRHSLDEGRTGRQVVGRGQPRQGPQHERDGQAGVRCAQHQRQAGGDGERAEQPHPSLR